MKKIILVSILAITLLGCSNDSLLEGLADDSSLEATIEAAAMDLDDGNYDSVIASLTALYTTTAPDPEIARLLASGYMGKAGIDFTNFIFYSTDGDADSFDIVEALLYLYIVPEDEDESDDEFPCNASNRTVLIVEDDASFIDGHCVGEVIEYLDNAKDIFYAMKNVGLASTDDLFQLSIASIVHYVIIVGNKTAVALNKTLDLPDDNDRYEPGLIPVPINKAAYKTYFENFTIDYDWARLDSTDFEEDNGDSLTTYQEDMVNVVNAIQAITTASQNKNNDLNDELDEFLREVTGITTGDITENVIRVSLTPEGLYNYIVGISQ